MLRGHATHQWQTLPATTNRPAVKTRAGQALPSAPAVHRHSTACAANTAPSLPATYMSLCVYIHNIYIIHRYAHTCKYTCINRQEKVWKCVLSKGFPGTNIHLLFKEAGKKPEKASFQNSIDQQSMYSWAF